MKLTRGGVIAMNLKALFAQIRSTRWLHNVGSVVFNKPRPDAEAMMFRWNGLGMGGYFFGLVRSNHVTIETPAVQKPKIQLV